MGRCHHWQGWLEIVIIVTNVLSFVTIKDDGTVQRTTGNVRYRMVVIIRVGIFKLAVFCRFAGCEGLDF
jgi:hypothetical protein